MYLETLRENNPNIQMKALILVHLKKYLSDKSTKSIDISKNRIRICHLYI